jgi:hypothetical protein
LVAGAAREARGATWEGEGDAFVSIDRRTAAAAGVYGGAQQALEGINW